jgi:hypothetical protein
LYDPAVDQSFALSYARRTSSGERLFVDYAGQSVAVIDAASGEIRRAQIFDAGL